MASQSVNSWYAGKNVLITGGNGFVGSCLVEKFLRDVPEGGDIYLVLRGKRNKTPEQRADDFRNGSVFEELLKVHPKTIFSRVKVVEGDIQKEDLGLSEANLLLLREKVNVIFHSAAVLDFTKNFKFTVDGNLVGTLNVLEFAKQCANLDVFVHVSSAYANSFKLEAEEVIYPPNAESQEIIALVNEKSEEEIVEATKILFKDHPNSYTFTKQLAEWEVKKMEKRFPCAIVRPSMSNSWFVEGAHPRMDHQQEWAPGFLMGAGFGVVRRLPMSPASIYDYIPVDIVVNTLIAAGFHAGSTKTTEVEIYQCTSSIRNPFRWIFVDGIANDFIQKYPLKNAIWYPYIKFLSTFDRYRFSALLFHYVPAFIFDTMLTIGGEKPRLVKLHQKIDSSLTIIKRFVFTEWTFPAVNTENLHRWLSLNDRNVFNLQISKLKWDAYIFDLMMGGRKYLANEELTTLPAARRKHNVLWTLHLLVQAAILFFVWYMFSYATGLDLKTSMFVVPLCYVLFSLI